MLLLNKLNQQKNWCMCVANSVINLPNYIKEQLFKHRKNPQDTDYQYHKRLQDRLQKAFSQFTEYMGQSDLMTELTEKIEKISIMEVYRIPRCL